METAKGKTREDAINRLADRIDSFEKYSQPHSRLMAELATHLARRMGLAPSDIDAITEAAMLHDIGLYTMSPPYHSLPRPLSFEARLDLWRHPVIGEQQMAKRDALRHAQLLVRWHHEWWNGSGYPDMLSFEDIPIGARILRAVELYSAVLCDRPYRSALNAGEALEALTSSAGTECDPYVVGALLALLADLRADIEGQQTKHAESFVEPQSSTQGDASATLDRRTALTSSDAPQDSWSSQKAAPGNSISSEPEQSTRAWGEGMTGFVPAVSESPEELTSQPVPNGFSSTEVVLPPPAPKPIVPFVQLLIERASSDEFITANFQPWHHWLSTQNNKKELLGFQASVLRQLDFRSIAIPFWSEVRLDWYLKAWGKIICANDSRNWAGVVARAHVEATAPLGEETITSVLENVYIPGIRLANPDLRKWFSETDAWWMDNLRRNIQSLDDEIARAQALTLGLQTGDYALSFNESTLELRRPLTTVFWRLAGRAFLGPAGQPHNRSSIVPAEDFIKHARADLLYLRLPSLQTHRGPQARADWREAWVTGAAVDWSISIGKNPNPPQSKQSYLAILDRVFRTASSYKSWAIEYQEPGLATAPDIVDLIKEYRSVKATYSKDVTEVAGGLRSYIIVGEAEPSR